MILHAPQITWLVLAAICLGVELAEHGKPKGGNHSFPMQVLVTAIGLALLWWGGFFAGQA
jgi:hypothetical protein